MSDRLCFVQLPHPGGEHGPDEAGALKGWETGQSMHKRKFLLCSGTWRDRSDGPIHEGKLVFWGEWEADSAVSPVPDRVPGGPAWLHRPFFEGPSARAIPQNTDPFVFGPRFLYTFCRQPRNRRLRELARGSVILFGSRKDGQFVLDTLFVVADSVDHTRETYKQVAAPRASAVFRTTTLDPMYAWEGTVGGRLYFGATVDDPVDGMFSGVPCLPAECGRTFARPAIVLPGLVKPTLAMAARTVVADREKLAGAWQSVVDQIYAGGLALGVAIDAPGARGSAASAARPPAPRATMPGG